MKSIPSFPEHKPLSRPIKPCFAIGVTTMEFHDIILIVSIECREQGVSVAVLICILDRDHGTEYSIHLSSRNPSILGHHFPLNHYFVER